MCPKTGGTAGIPAKITVTAGITAQYPISIPAGIPVISTGHNYMPNHVFDNIINHVIKNVFYHMF